MAWTVKTSSADESRSGEDKYWTDQTRATGEKGISLSDKRGSWPRVPSWNAATKTYDNAYRRPPPPPPPGRGSASGSRQDDQRSSSQRSLYDYSASSSAWESATSQSDAGRRARSLSQESSDDCDSVTRSPREEDASIQESPDHEPRVHDRYAKPGKSILRTTMSKQRVTSPRKDDDMECGNCMTDTEEDGNTRQATRNQKRIWHSGSRSKNSSSHDH
jgi:hypothetical protein